MFTLLDIVIFSITIFKAFSETEFCEPLGIHLSYGEFYS